MRSSTSSASASWGITSARTKLVTSRRLHAGAREQVDQPHLLVGGDDLRLVLEAVAGADLADADSPGRPWPRATCTLHAVSAPVVLLAGGTGGAKLARGMLDVVGPDLVVIANTADDVEIYGGYVSPDPDLVPYWLADRIDERGWGIAGDTFTAMDAPREPARTSGSTSATRTCGLCSGARRLAEGARLTETILDLARSSTYGARCCR